MTASSDRSDPTPAAAAPTVRPARPEDVPAIVGLIRELAAFEQLEHLAQATPETLHPHLFGEQAVAECLVADAPAGHEGGGPLVAFALYFTNFSTFLARPGLYLEDLYVQPAHRGGGLGRAMLVRLAQIAVARGCGRFEWCVLDWNVDAQAFYRKMGATMKDEWRLCRLTGDALLALGAPDGPGT
jgi:GNAT superfamily N-acetyltransferase